MTREAKIGLLTGLGVIVLIGVLLSEYLGGPAGAAAGQNRMAALPIGTGYRERVMQPVGVPGMVRSESTANAPLNSPSGNEIAGFPPAYAANPSAPAASSNDATLSPPASGEVAIAPAVTPIADGQVLALAAGGLTDRPPTIQLDDMHTVSLVPAGQPAPTAAARPAATGERYVVVAGDTLGKIAKKFYQSSKPEDQQRIVTANPTVLKNTGTMLRIGWVMVIPGTTRATATKAAPKADAKSDGRSLVLIRSPGQTGAAAAGTSDARRLASAADLAKKDAGKTDSAKKGSGVYVVQDGDTLEKIARKLSPSHAAEVAKQLASLNKIKDPRGLQVGMKLKVPAKV